uniref:ATP-dependent DNA helicase n=2 Tax=Globodera pallida TaxID=36090 RepID=A0A183CP13_GLOPA
MVNDFSSLKARADASTLNRESVIAAASTGIAALLLIGGGTAHRLFYVPNDITDETAPMINFESPKAEQLREADLIIIDEVSMLSSRVLKYIDRLLRDVCGAAKPFGGKVIVISGDWRQLAPHQENKRFAIGFSPLAMVSIKRKNNQEQRYSCPTNNDVQYINNLALDRMSGNATDYMSIDEPLETVEDNNTFRADFNMEAVHNEMPSGIPPHKLKLKVGTPIMLLRNLDVHQGLCNGTRLQVMRMSDDNLFCRILTGPRADVNQTIVLPRIKFEYGRGRNHRGLRFQRLQFPVRACFAMTVNKAQGQTLQRMALVLRGKQCFAHGQVYVAMSRVTRMDGIRVYAPSCQSGDYSYIANVVYHELLDVHIPPRPQHSALTEATHEQEVGTHIPTAEDDMENSDQDYFD